MGDGLPMAKVQWSETVRGSETVFSQSNQSYNKSGKSWLFFILLSLQKKCYYNIL